MATVCKTASPPAVLCVAYHLLPALHMLTGKFSSVRYFCIDLQFLNLEVHHNDVENLALGQRVMGFYVKLPRVGK